MKRLLTEWPSILDPAMKAIQSKDATLSKNLTQAKKKRRNPNSKSRRRMNS